MSILSVYFLAFLLVSSIVFYLVPNKVKPYVILLCNVYFYLQFGLSNFVFLLFSIISVFFGAHIVEKAKNRKLKKLMLGAVLALNIGLLFFVKFIPYLLGLAQHFFTFDASNILSSIVVPIGISFYTLQICGYLIDVFREKYSAEKNFLKFVSFSTFFPVMLQGPISRYDQLAPQLFNKEKRENIYHNYTHGAQLMLWGFFKKLVIADRAALLVNQVFDNYTSYSGMIIILAILLYTIQIYADFSGCVDICRGAAQLFGINVIDNFRQPYFAKSIQDFWKRWHISLSSWFRDYLYIPLGGNRKGTVRKYVNLLIVFFVSGLWHGAGIHYIVWGMLQGIFQIIGAVTLPFKEKACGKLKINRKSSCYIFLQQIVTFVLVNISWLFFRANGTIAAAKMFISAVDFSQPLSQLPGIDYWDILILAVSLLSLFFVSYYKEKGVGIRDKISQTVLPVRWLIYLTIFAIIVIFGVYGPGYSSSAFIYMNF